MSTGHRMEGAQAFAAGVSRHENPHEPDSEAWLDWMDGFDHALVRAEHPLPDGMSVGTVR